jgi:arylsulfatase A-like enzyme
MNDRNVVVICLDTVRQDYFEQHATELPSRADVRYSNCRAPSSWTVPSHASFLTGTLPHEHGAHAYNTTFERISEEETFLGDLDHRTLCVSANPYVSSAFGAD